MFLPYRVLKTRCVTCSDVTVNISIPGLLLSSVVLPQKRDMSVTMCRVRTHPEIHLHWQKTTDKINLFPPKKPARIKDGRMTAEPSELLLTGCKIESFPAVEEDLEGRSWWGDWMRRAPAQVDVSGVCHVSGTDPGWEANREHRQQPAQSNSAAKRGTCSSNLHDSAFLSSLDSRGESMLLKNDNKVMRAPDICSGRPLHRHTFAPPVR